MKTILKSLPIAILFILTVTFIFVILSQAVFFILNLISPHESDVIKGFAAVFSLGAAIILTWRLSTRQPRKPYGPDTPRQLSRIAPQKTDLRIGDIVAGARSAMPRIFVQFFGLMLIPPTLNLAFEYGARPNLAPQGTGEAVMETAVAFLDYLSYYWISCAMVFGVIATLANRPLPLSKALKLGVGRILPVLVGAALYWLAISVGTILLVFPAFLFSAVYYLTIPAIVVERINPIHGFQRSAILTRAYLYRVLGIILSIFAIYAITLMIVYGITQLIPIPGNGEITTDAEGHRRFYLYLGSYERVATFDVISALAAAAMAVVFTVTYTTTYVQLRGKSEDASVVEIYEQANLGKV